MTDTLIVVGARLNSSRLPRKHLLPLAGKPLIERLFERLETIGGDRKIVLATTADEFNKPLVEWAEGTGREVYAYEGDVDDLVGRIHALFERVRPRRLVYICGDCPLIDSQLIERLLEALAQTKSGQMAHQAKVAPDPEGRETVHEGIHVYSAEGWQRLEQKSVTALEREHVGLADRENPVLDAVYIDLPESHWGIKQRFSVDTAADYHFQELVYSRWFSRNAPSKPVDINWLLQELRSHPELRAINAHVMQKSGFRRYGKALFLAEASPRRGLGQLRRMVTLAERLQEESGMGAEIWILGEETELDWLKFTHQRWFISVETLIQELEKHSASLVVVDLWPQNTPSWRHLRQSLKKIKNSGTYLVGIDRMTEWHSVCDSVIVPGFYLSKRTSSTKVVYGLEYVILPRQLPVDLAAANNCDVLVLTGGSDACGYGSFLPDRLDRYLPPSTHLLWVQGPYAVAPRLPRNTRCQWRIVRSPGQLEQLISSAKVVLAVYGVSVLEALAACVPTVVLPAPGVVAPEELEDFEALGVALVWRTPQTDEPVLLRDLLSSESLRYEVHQHLAAKDLKNGTARVVSHVLKGLARSSEGKV
ncbi:NTP transferase domain-containing protein [Marinobacteraceae bacterium S3BR75-40.1]